MLFTDEDEVLREENPLFKVQALVDPTNKRLWVFEGKVSDPTAFTRYIREKALERGFGKIVFPCRESYTAGLKVAGFREEARAEGFFSGDTGYFLVLYPDPERESSEHLVDEVDMLREIIAKPQESRHCPDQAFTFRPAAAKDIPAMTALFSEVFASYPVPVDDPAYLLRTMEYGTRFQLALDGDRLAGVAAAELEAVYGRAEMTDCATLPRYRGQGLASCLINALENECYESGMRCFYSLSRAGQYGVNLVFHRLGYRYRGTLINNAHIGGRFEDLHVWVKFVGSST
ncbi:MAG: putative beta-lysine N-acetyltransferase [Desulforudis sp.]|nr:MAG: putative beta-lysine N-acetyltransferase [Desulforudis sp.]